MFNAHPRKTSIPIHFTFTHSNRLCLGHSAKEKDKPQYKRSASMSVPPETAVHHALPATAQPEWTPVEISNFAATLQRVGLMELLREYKIDTGFAFPNRAHFTRPFRITVLAAGLEEALRLVRELDKKDVDGREISVKLAVKIGGDKDREVSVHDVADEMKIGIINIARVYFPNLANTILEVHEMTEEGQCFAFLQKRAPVTAYSDPMTHVLEPRNEAKWEFVLGSSVEVKKRDEKIVPRLEALKALQQMLEKQGVLGRIWEKWETRRAMAV